MGRSWSRLGVVGIAVSATVGAGAVEPSSVVRPAPASVLARIGELRFDTNAGQWADGSRFHATGHGVTAAFDERGIRLLGGEAQVSLRIHDGVDVVPTGLDRFGTVITRITAEGPRNVPTFRGLAYRGVRPGVDLVVHAAASGALEYDVELDRGIDPATIELDVEGGEPTITAQGELVIDLGGGRRLTQRAPHTYQLAADGTRIERASRFVLRGPQRYAFQVSAFDPDRSLIIDPVLESSSYFGGAGFDSARRAAADASGNFYLTGYTGSTDNQSAPQSYVAKLDPTGQSLTWLTYVPVPAFAMAVSRTGQVVLCGQTFSLDLPTRNAIQPTYTGEGDVFVTVVAPSGADLDYATYLGGPLTDSCSGVSVDATGSVSVLASGPAYPGVDAGRPLNLAAIKLSASGDRIVKAFTTPLKAFTLVTDRAAVDSRGRLVFVQGLGPRPPFTTTPGAMQPTLAGAADLAITRLNAEWDAVDFATYLGGKGMDTPSAIAFDAEDAILITGRTSSTDFPLVAPAQAKRAREGDDAFVVKVAPSGDHLVFSTYLGGVHVDEPGGIGADANGNVVVAGSTTAADFPVLDSLQEGLRGPSDAFVAFYDPAGRLLGSTLLGGAGGESEIVVAAAGDHALVAGSTFSADFPLVAPFEAALEGGSDAFVSVLRTPPRPDGGGAAMADAGDVAAPDAGDGEGAASSDAVTPPPATDADADAAPLPASAAPSPSARGCGVGGDAPTSLLSALLTLALLARRRRG